MKALRVYRQAIRILTLVCTFAVSPASMAQESIDVTEITPTLFVFATSSGNVVASVGPDGVLLIGKPSTAGTPLINGIL